MYEHVSNDLCALYVTFAPNKRKKAPVKCGKFTVEETVRIALLIGTFETAFYCIIKEKWPKAFNC